MAQSSITNEGNGEFIVESQSMSGKSYSVQFGDTITMPSCSCFDWQKHHWPCKHFLAIYNHFPEWGWEKMSPSYTSSPYFKIDSSVIPVDSEIGAMGSDTQSLSYISCKSTCSSENEFYTVPDKANVVEKEFDDEEDDLKAVINPQHEGRCCREILKEIQNLTYLCPDGSCLADLKQDLENLLTNFKQHIPSENGILVEASKPKKKKLSKEQKTKKKEYAKLPLRLKLKRKKNDLVDVSSPVKKQRKVIPLLEQDISDVLEKEHSMLPNDTIFDTIGTVEKSIPPAFTSNHINAHVQDSIGNLKEKQDPLVEDLQCLPDAPESNIPPERQEPLRKCVILVDETSADPETWLTINDPNCPGAKVTLYQASKKNILDKKGWLTDSEIHAGQVLLKMEFPLVDGLCDPAVHGDLVTPAISEFVQIINIGAHWICMSTISSGPGTVNIYDTLYNTANSVAIRHACHMLMYNGDKISFVNERVQRQINFNDCGLFSLAIATDLCNGTDPTTQAYDQGSLRKHYVNCLESGRMIPFPKTTRRVLHHLGSTRMTVAIYCVCRMPNDKKEYVQCSQCNAWYHPLCVNIPEWAIKTKRKWKCGKCISKQVKKPYLH